MIDKTTAIRNDPAGFPPSISTLAAAKRLGVAVPTVQRWLDQGVLRGWKTPGGHRRIELSSVQAYIASRVDPAPLVAAEAPLLLIIEDDPIYLEVLREYFAERLPQARIRVARDGFEGLAEVSEHRPTCVVTNIRMPHMDGVELIRHLLQRHEALAGHVLVLSGGDGQELAALGLLQSSVLFLPKTTDMEVVLTAVARMLQP